MVFGCLVINSPESFAGGQEEQLLPDGVEDIQGGGEDGVEDIKDGGEDGVEDIHGGGEDTLDNIASVEEDDIDAKSGSENIDGQEDSVIEEDDSEEDVIYKDEDFDNVNSREKIILESNITSDEDLEEDIIVDIKNEKEPADNKYYATIVNYIKSEGIEGNILPPVTFFFLIPVLIGSFLKLACSLLLVHGVRSVSKNHQTFNANLW